MTENKETAAMLTKAREEYAIAELSNDQYIAGIQAKVLALPPATEKEGYELRRKTIADLRKIRTTIEARRKELKADSLAYGRRIDAFARHWTEQITAIENPLVLEKGAVDEAKEKARQAIINAERIKQEEEARQRIQAEEARLAEIRKAEEAKLAEEREKLRQAAERIRKIEEEQKAERQKAQEEHLARLQEIERQQTAAAVLQQAERAKQLAEQERLNAEYRKLEVEQARVKQEERDRLNTIEAEKQTKLQAERLAAEEAQREKERLERAERIKPDIAKLREYREVFKGFLNPPRLRDPEAIKAANDAWDAVSKAGEELGIFIGRMIK